MSQSLAFYRDVLDFAVKWSWSAEGQFDESQAPEFAIIECGEGVVFLNADGGGRNSSLFLELPTVEDVDELAGRVEPQVPLLESPEDKPWGSREFFVADPDGHVLRFSCPLNRRRAAS